MKVKPSANIIRQNFSLKSSLIRLNRDLEKVLFRIDECETDGLFIEHSHKIQLERLSNLQQAILLLEDRRFLTHRGFEFRAPLRIVRRVLSGKRLGAISTIDQQLVRICTGRYERTLRRKVREVFLAFLLNAHRSKANIFYAYIHNSYLGYRLEGCEITAQFLFSKPANELSIAEAAFISALLARPLPKVVFEAVKFEKTIRQITPSHLIHIGNLCGLTWAKNVELRYQYVLRMFPSSPKILRTR